MDLCFGNNFFSLPSKINSGSYIGIRQNVVRMPRQPSAVIVKAAPLGGNIRRFSVVHCLGPFELFEPLMKIIYPVAPLESRVKSGSDSQHPELFITL